MIVQNQINKIAEARLANYTAFWGRMPDYILRQETSRKPHIEVYRFSPVNTKWFFQKWFIPVNSQYVYISGGMSDEVMPVNKKDSTQEPLQIELATYSNEIYYDDSQEVDLIMRYLGELAYIPFENNNIFLGICHTFYVGKPLMHGSEMTGFFFGATPSVNLNRLCHASINAKRILQVVPISDSEREFAIEEGPLKLLDYFEKYGIQPIFDLKRKPKI